MSIIRKRKTYRILIYQLSVVGIGGNWWRLEMKWERITTGDTYGLDTKCKSDTYRSVSLWMAEKMAETWDDLWTIRKRSGHQRMHSSIGSWQQIIDQIEVIWSNKQTDSVICDVREETEERLLFLVWLRLLRAWEAPSENVKDGGKRRTNHRIQGIQSIDSKYDHSTKKQPHLVSGTTFLPQHDCFIWVILLHCNQNCNWAKKEV